MTPALPIRRRLDRPRIGRHRVDRQLAVATAAQLALLAALDTALDLGPLGWLAGSGFAAGLWGLLAGGAPPGGREDPRTADPGPHRPSGVAGRVGAPLVGGVVAHPVTG